MRPGLQKQSDDAGDPYHHKALCSVLVSVNLQVRLSPVHDLVEDEVGELPVYVLQVLRVLLLQRARRRGADFNGVPTCSALQEESDTLCSSLWTNLRDGTSDSSRHGHRV